MNGPMDVSGNERIKATRWKLPFAAVVVLLVVLLTAFFVHSQPTKPGSKNDLNNRLLAQVRGQATPITVATVQYGSIRRLLNLNGSIESLHSANVSAAVPGQVQTVLVTEGAHVHPGSLLAQLNPAQMNAQASQSRSGVAAAQSQYLKALSARQLTYQQSAGDVDRSRIGVREALTGFAKASAGAGAPAIRQAEDSARQAHAGAREAASALQRSRFLWLHGVIPQSTLEDVKTKAEQAAAGADAADAAVRQARQGATPEDRQLAAEKVAEARQGLAAAIDAERGRNAIANSDVQAALTQVHGAEAALRLSELQQVSGRIVSPIDGIVSAVRIHAGEAAMPGVPLFSITSMASVYFRAALSDVEKNQVTAGNAVQVTVDAIPGRTFNGKVTGVVPVENPGAQGFEVRIALETSSDRIPPGSSARAVVQTASANHTLIIPSTAVVNDANGQPFVFVIQNGVTAHRQPITTGIVSENKVQALAGLQAGQQIATTGAELLRDGAAVTIDTSDNNVAH